MLSVKSVKQAVIATFLTLSLVTTLIVFIATPFCYDLVWNALFEVAMEQSEQQANKFSNLADENIKHGMKQSGVVDNFQQILGNSSYDQGHFVCIVDNDGKILAHPNEGAVGSVIQAMLLEKDKQLLSSPVPLTNSLEPSRNIVEFTRSKKVELLYQYPISEVGVSVWVHTNSVILDEKAEKVMLAIGYVALPSIFFIVLIGTLAVRSVGRSYENRLEGLAQTDGLTGLANRRHFDERIDFESKRALRDKSLVSLAMMDIDYFKLYNDNYGHQAGDNVLQKVADCLDNNVKRSTDLVARYGGEEFAIIFVGCSRQEAVRLAKNLVRAVEDLAIEHAYSKCSNKITCSMGLVTSQSSKKLSTKKIIRMADKALYQGKESGRNQLYVSE